jgi:undecaprenyl-diphosphatase
MFEIVLNYDWAVLHWIHNTLTCPVLDYLMPKITELGDGGIIWILAGFALIATKQYRKYGIILIIGLVLGVMVGNVFLKNLIERPRPCWIDHSVSLLIANPSDYSFPSGHTLASVIAATILTLSNKKFGYIAIPLATLIAFSRLYLYVHFPSDVIGATAIGLIIGLSAFHVVQKFIFKGNKVQSIDSMIHQTNKGEML